MIDCRSVENQFGKSLGIGLRRMPLQRNGSFLWFHSNENGFLKFECIIICLSLFNDININSFTAMKSKDYFTMIKPIIWNLFSILN